MGKRKSSTKAVTKPKIVLSTAFKCLFCHHEKAITVKLDKSTMFGSLSCKSCGQTFSSPINNVYADWVDACEEARAKQPVKARPANRGPHPFEHGYGGGVKMNMSSKPARDDDDDDDNEEDERRPAPRRAKSLDDDDDDEDEDDRPAPKRSKDASRSSKPARDYASDDEDDVDEARDSSRDKRRRVPDSDDEDDEDDD